MAAAELHSLISALMPTAMRCQLSRTDDISGQTVYLRFTRNRQDGTLGPGPLPGRVSNKIHLGQCKDGVTIPQGLSPMDQSPIDGPARARHNAVTVHRCCGGGRCLSA